MVIMASEVGVLDVAPENVKLKERLHPGRIFLVDTREGRIIDDSEIKQRYIDEQPYEQWLKGKPDAPGKPAQPEKHPWHRPRYPVATPAGVRLYP